MSGLERTSLILDKIIQFIHLLLHNICYGVTFSGNWLHNKAVDRKKFLGGGGGELAYCVPVSFARSLLSALYYSKFGSWRGGGGGGGGGDCLPWFMEGGGGGGGLPPFPP